MPLYRLTHCRTAYLGNVMPLMAQYRNYRARQRGKLVFRDGEGHLFLVIHGDPDGGLQLGCRIYHRAASRAIVRWLSRRTTWDGREPAYVICCHADVQPRLEPPLVFAAAWHGPTWVSCWPEFRFRGDDACTIRVAESDDLLYMDRKHPEMMRVASSDLSLPCYTGDLADMLQPRWACDPATD